MNLSQLIAHRDVRFRTGAEVRAAIRQACAANSDIAEFHTLGKSEEGRPIDAVVLGRGERTVSLIAGAHADEPVGPETLRHFILGALAQPQQFAELFEAFRFAIVPHINPDGEARNQPWIRQWPAVTAYLQHAFRELPGRDLEFGFPDMRPENRLVSAFLKQHTPIDLHLSLHGMGFSEGAMLLIERHWIDRTMELRFHFAEYAKALGLRLHDHDRGGEKGFLYIAPGFSTTPQGRAMQAYFRRRGDEKTAAKFHLSSMEWVRQVGGDPLCLVTELPLFIIGSTAGENYTGQPAAYLSFQSRLPALRAKLAAGKPIDADLAPFQIRPLDLSIAMRFQLYVIQLGLQTVAPEHAG